jgi:tRNA(fMet)-specific endonuclease VapC
LTVHDIDDRVVVAYGEIDTASHSFGHKMGKNDLWIAATARVLGLTLLTTDKDFDHLHPTWVDREWVDPTSKLPP